MIKELFEYIEDAVNRRAEQVNTCFPAQVVSYDPATQRADVKPCIKRPVRTDTEGKTAEPLPDFLDIPVIHPRVGNSILHIPLAAGDYVLVLATQWSISEWYRQGDAQVDPGDMAHHSLGSCVAIAGVFPEGKIATGLNATDILLGSFKTGAEAGPSVRITTTKVVVGKNGEASKRVARKTDPVRVTFTPDHAALILTGAGPGSPCSSLGPITLTGEITEGSLTVEATD